MRFNDSANCLTAEQKASSAVGLLGSMVGEKFPRQPCNVSYKYLREAMPNYMFKPTPELSLRLLWPYGRRGLTWR